MVTDQRDVDLLRRVATAQAVAERCGASALQVLGVFRSIDRFARMRARVLERATRAETQEEIARLDRMEARYASEIERLAGGIGLRVEWPGVWPVFSQEERRIRW